MTSGRRVLFVTGGGPVVGLGHVRRCLALAGALRDHLGHITRLGTRWVHGLPTDEPIESPFAVLRFQTEIDRYNGERQHSALGYLTPRAWREQFYQLPQAA